MNKREREQFKQAKQLIMAKAFRQTEPVTVRGLLDSIVTTIPDSVLRMAVWDLIAERYLGLNQDLRVGVPANMEA